MTDTNTRAADALAPISDDVVERVALAILNSDREMRGLHPLTSRENVPDSDGYVTNARAAINAIGGKHD